MTNRFSYIVAVLGILALILNPGCRSKENAAAPDITFSESGVDYQGRTIPLPCTLQQLTDVLGPPSRTVKKESRIVVWDDKGMIAYFAAREDSAGAISAALAKSSDDYWPNNIFVGKVKVDAVVLNSQSEEKDLRAAGLSADGVVRSIWTRKMGSLRLNATTDGGRIDFLNLEVPLRGD